MQCEVEANVSRLYIEFLFDRCYNRARVSRQEEKSMATVFEELRTLIEQLSPAHQQKVLAFAQELAQSSQFVSPMPTTPLPPGTPGHTLLRFMLLDEDVEAMESALEDCEGVEPDE
jgi:hypothetical protein